MKKYDNEISILWNYLCMGQKVKSADVILVCGGHDAGVARKAAKLYKENIAPIIVVSGGVYREVFGIEKKVLEADILGKLVSDAGVPQQDILYERDSKNTGENLDYSIKLLAEKGYKFDKIVMIQKPYAERRALCLAKKRLPDKEITMTSESISREEYFNQDIPDTKIVSMMVGEVQRLIYSPKFGWIDKITIPDKVLQAYEVLCNAGYTSRLMSKEVIEKCMIGTQDNLSININGK